MPYNQVKYLINEETCKKLDDFMKTAIESGFGFNELQSNNDENEIYCIELLLEIKPEFLKPMTNEADEISIRGRLFQLNGGFQEDRKLYIERKSKENSITDKTIKDLENRLDDKFTNAQMDFFNTTSQKNVIQSFGILLSIIISLFALWYSYAAYHA